jgi:Raf kinase inhibitor-like YbhB/YbcL family protein
MTDRPWRTLALAVVLVAAAGCGDDGRDLRPPAEGATVPTTATTTPSAQANPPVGSSDPSGALRLTSPAFEDGAAIPARHSCEGENVSPPLEWVGVPVSAVEVALTVTDPDAGSFVHWVVGALDPALGGLAEGVVPPGAVEARNQTTEFGWFGPCPPAGPAHRYVFTLYALTETVGLETGVSGADAIAAIAATPGVATTLTGTYASGG